MITTNLYIGSRYPVGRKKLRQVVEQLLSKNNITHAQVDVSIVGQRRIKTLNETQLKGKGGTDVLAFPQHEKQQLDDFPLPANQAPHLGDVVISYPMAVIKARRFGKLVDDQLGIYLEHGLMHLLGYHHH